MRHHFRREQRLARRLALLVALLLVVVLAPLLLLPAFRLDLAHRFGWAPGADAERLFGEGAPVELVVLVEEVSNPLSGPSRRYTAAYAAERTDEAVLLHDLNDRARVLTLPLTGYTRIAAAADMGSLLFVEEGGQDRAVLVTVATGEVRPLPPGQTDPGLPGDWAGELPLAAVGCGGVSPRSTWVACVRAPSRLYLFGSWELQAHRYGRPEERRHLYRGRGTDPLVGWAADESALYFQNELGLWRVEVPPET